MTANDVTPALLYALASDRSRPEPADISDALYAMVRDCRWAIRSIQWRSSCSTFHLGFAETPRGAVVIVVGADAPVLALSDTRGDDGCFRYFDDSAFSSAAAYAPQMRVLSAAELLRDLTSADNDWLANLDPQMARDLKYWKPTTVGEVIFNQWD